MLSKNILSTIIYYDILDFPLTSFELWKYLLAENSCTLGDVVEALESDELKNHLEEYRGFYFLKGRKGLVEKRIQNDKNSIVKYKTAERVVWWLRFVPFVRTVAVTGTLAMKNCEKDSDIDFFMVLEKGRIFTGRLFVTAMVHFLGRRRHGKKIKNRICLNYFITTGSLEIQRQDLFAANEYSFIYPFFNTPLSLRDISPHLRGEGLSSVFDAFNKANIGWINKFKPNWEIPQLKPARYFVEHSKFSLSVQKLFESLINWPWDDRIESWLKRKQVARIERNPLTKKEGAYIEYSDENLIFLPEPQGPKVQEKFLERFLLTEKV